MIREYVEDHEWNRTIKGKPPSGRGSVWFVRGVIKCDGIEYCFAGWSEKLEDAQWQFDSFKNSDCVCIPRSDVSLCPIHSINVQARPISPGENIDVRSNA